MSVISLRLAKLFIQILRMLPIVSKIMLIIPLHVNNTII